MTRLESTTNGLLSFSRMIHTRSEQHRAVVTACLDAGVDSVTVWGVTDDRSWITSWRDYPERYTGQPLLFDAEGRATPSCDAVAAALRERGRA